MTTSVTCKSLHGEFMSQPISVIVGQNEGIYGVHATEFNIMEISDVEYTHLQHVIQSQVEGTEQGGSGGARPEIRNAASSSAPPSSGPILAGCHHVGNEEVVLDREPGSSLTRGERTPPSGGEVPSSVLGKARFGPQAGRSRVDVCGQNGTSLLEMNGHPPARVCLEKRFSRTPCYADVREPHSESLNTLLKPLRHPSESTGIAVHSQTDKTFPDRGSIFSTGHGGLAHIQEGGKHAELVIPNHFNCRQGPLKQSSTCVPHGRQILSTIAGSGHLNGGGRSKDAIGGRRLATPLECMQRRERHNNKERDRRRRIRQCCDELNLLVPFCSSETDKATTLQWTTAFLKYIREIHGDSLKQDFQSTFSVKTGVMKSSIVSSALEQQLNSSTKETYGTSNQW